MTQPTSVGARIVVVDDTPANIQTLTAILKERGYNLSVATNGRHALEVIQKVRPDLVLMDVMMPEMDGYEACRQLKASGEWSDLPIIFLSAKTETADIVRGFEAGAVDYVAKPFNAHELLARVNTHLTLQSLRRGYEARNKELARELEVAQELLTDARRRVEGALLGDSPAIRALRESIARQASTDAVVLLTGPQGAGHEAAARAIHHASPRSKQAFIHVNCALLPPGDDPGVLSAKGAADDDGGSRMSLVELAACGTLYLDEVQRLAADVQARLAEVLEGVESALEKGEPPVPDVRFIASCSAPLSSGTFHPKLLALLQRRQLRVPSLAERPEDVPEIALFFVRQQARRIGAVVESISEQSMSRLRKYRWPGDVRELQSLIERAVASSRETVMEIDEAVLDEGVPLGLYRLMHKLGEGGMGEVWQGRHQLLARPCAVKLIRPDLLDQSNREAAIERFRLEAQSIAALSSPNTVRIYDFGVSENGSFYFVMELLDGIDLNQLVDMFGPMPPERVASVMRQVCRSLGEAHAVGLLHRDIKPHNIFLCRLGLDYDVVKVLDFGLVKSLRSADVNITAEGTLTGTPAYMPPERAMGKQAEERSDLYSLGCVAYWMLTGQTVFEGDPIAMLLHHAGTPPTPPSEVLGHPIPERLEQIVLACLAKHPTGRPPSAIDLWQQLGEIRFENAWSPERAEAWWQEHLPKLSKEAKVDLSARTIQLDD